LVKDFVYGAIDGTVTTLAVVAGVAGAGLRPAIALVLGLANLLADGFSMATSSFLATRAEAQRRQHMRRIEERHVELVPAGEREELRQLLAREGLRGRLLEDAVAAVSADRNRWVEHMLREEHGFAPVPPHPLRAALATFLAFVFVGALPLSVYVADLLPGTEIASPFAWSVALGGFAFFAVGAVKGRAVGQAWWRGGGETLALGGAAAAIAFTVGVALGGVA
jgi:VIT1/CCC1 family predicted Fe2+/Mn2+ transporter